MDLEMIIVSEVSQTEEDEYVTYIWPQKKKKDTNERIYKTETDSHLKNKSMVNQRVNNMRGEG